VTYAAPGAPPAASAEPAVSGHAGPGLLIGTEARLAPDAAVLVFATAAGVTVSALLLPRLAR
jgi:hypothetical protein